MKVKICAILICLLACTFRSQDKCAVDVSYQPTIRLADFASSTVIDNPLMPLIPGTQLFYKGGEETIEVTVTSNTKVIQGVTCVVVRDTAKLAGEIIEDIFDWFAQDINGNVWYFGEDTKEYEDGEVVSTEGSWEAGVDGAQPGIVMYGKTPKATTSYRQEYYACQAEDMAQIVNDNATVELAMGTYKGCLQTRDYTPLEPAIEEHKFYCKGIGLVLEQDPHGEEKIELIKLVKPAAGSSSL